VAGARPGNVLRHFPYRDRTGRLCYPGTVDGADLPPRPECAPRWQPRFRSALPFVGMTLLVGSYAQAYYLKGRKRQTLTETVRAFREYLPEFFVLPHPSWRNKGWIRKNPWFTRLVIPELRKRVHTHMNAGGIRQV